MRKVKVKSFIILIIVLLLIGSGIYLFLKQDKIGFSIKKEIGYLASSTNTVNLYEYKKEDESESLNNSLEVVRGEKVIYYKDSKLVYEDKNYIKIKYKDKDYYVLEELLVKKFEDVVLEDTLYVRTSYNLLKDLNGNLLDLVKKGSSVEIIGFNKLLSDGSVDLYKVKVGESTGYFYSKYLLSFEEEAKKNYDPEGISKIHETKLDKLGGGNGGSLDYYPVEKPNFSDNKMPEQVYALYINGSKGIKNNIQAYIDYAKTTKINAFVVDIKDNCVPAY